MLRLPLAFSLLVAGAACHGRHDNPSRPPESAPALPDARAQPAKPPPGWRFQTPSGTPAPRGAVVSAASLASDVGANVLAAGGNAVDAAIATAFALAVVFPTAGNVGGGGFLVAHVGRENFALDFRETAPAKATPAAYVDAAGHPTDASREGFRAAGVPGTVAGLWAAYQKLGSKKVSWPDLVAPAVKLADEGFVVGAPFAASVASQAKRLGADPASAALFLPGGVAPVAGARWRDPDLAAVLRRIAADGMAGFYAGPTASMISKAMAAHGGFVTASDLTHYEAKWRTPLEFDYRHHHLVTMPPPSSGGATVAMICHILEGYDLTSLGWHSAGELHLVAEAMRRAFAARNARLGDPDFVVNPLDALLSKGWADAARATIDPRRATPSTELTTAGPSVEGPHTTHLSVVDAEGNAAALTTTINDWFGAGVTVAGAGFVLNNEMDDFAVAPGQPNQFGLVQGATNAVAPGKRMLSSMSPTIVFDPGGKLELVTGAAGGPTIITAVFNEVSNVVDYGFDVADAVAAPRIHQQHLPDQIDYEAGGLPEDTSAQLRAMGYTLHEEKVIADAPAIGLGPSGRSAAPEPRRAGGSAATPP